MMRHPLVKAYGWLTHPYGNVTDLGWGGLCQPSIKVLNANFPIVFKPGGSVTLSKLMQYEKTCSGRLVKFGGSTTDVRPEFENAPRPMLVIVCGSSTFNRLTQSLNASLPIVRKPRGKFTFLRLAHR